MSVTYLGRRLRLLQKVVDGARHEDDGVRIFDPLWVIDVLAGARR